MLDWFTNIKDILEMTPTKRNLLISYLLLGGAIVFLHTDNASLKQQSMEENSSRRALVDEERRLCNEQLVANRIEYQRQFTEHTIQSNEAISKLNDDYEKKSKVYLDKIVRINRDLTELKNEINN
jgi:shikimate kinase